MHWLMMLSNHLAPLCAESPWNTWPFGPGHTGGWLLSISKFAFIGLVLALIILFLRLALTPRGGGKLSPSKRKALESLDMRLARGEITPEEYAERKRALLEE